VLQGGSNNEFMYLASKPSTSQSETHAALLTTTQQFMDFELKSKVITFKQQRQNYPPNNWETAWIMWNWLDNYHQNSFNLKKKLGTSYRRKTTKGRIIQLRSSS
jgi:hypothetical protein